MERLTPSGDEWLEEFVNQLDDVILQYNDIPNHNLAGALLSRIVLLMQQDPSTGKDLVRFVWEKLDEIEQGDPGNLI